jgi:hypothetical protein
VAKAIRLSKPIELFGKSIAEIELKEPRGGMYVRLGDPRVLVFNASGSGYWVERDEITKAYLEELVACPNNADVTGGVIVNLMALEDVMEAKEQLFLFFTDAAARRAAKKSTPSSSGPTP